MENHAVVIKPDFIDDVICKLDLIYLANGESMHVVPPADQVGWLSHGSTRALMARLLMS